MKNIDQNLLLSMFTYQNGNLYRKISNSNRVKVGEQVGWLDGKGYLSVSIGSCSLKLHRAIFLMHHGFLPKYIDHIDGNPLNNKIENLREANRQQNMYNSKLRKNNTSGIKNVFWIKNLNKWHVKFIVNGKSKCFGCYSDISEASAVANQKRLELHKEFARSK